MKLNINRKKLRFGGMAIALTAFIIAAVVLLNVLFMALATNNRWYIDMTSDAIYTLSDECRDLVKNSIEGEGGVNDQREKYNKDNGLNPGDEGYQEEAKVTIYFCDDKDILANTTDYMRYVYNTALDLDAACDFINIDYLNWEYNPTSVQKYMAMGNTINSYSIIVESGTEYRVFTLESMFIVNENQEVWAYDGEKKLAGAILGVTSADQPVAYITTGHGESFYDTSFFELLQDAGYKVVFEGMKGADGKDVPKLTDKENNPLDPNGDVRLVVVYNPTSDFQTDGVSEIDRLDRFLETNKSLMVFMDPYSPILTDFEEWLATWGIRFDRYAVGNDYYSYMIKDSTSSLDSAGYAVKANYVTSGGIGKSIYSQFIDKGRTPPVYFDKAMSISYTFDTMTESDAEDQSKDFTYGYKFSNGVTKEIFDVFTAPSGAVAIANGTTVANSAESNPTGTIEYVYRDSQGNVYRLNDTKDKIVDSEGNELARSESDSEVFLAKDGKTELIISGKMIVAKNLAEGEQSGATAIVTEIIEFSGKKYTLSEDGTQILDASGNALKADEQSGLYITADGSYLAIETIGDLKSIKVHRGAQSSANPFKLMTITRRHDTVQVNNYQSENQDAYVLACGSTAYATEKYLKSAVYGNTNVLLSATTLMGREVVPVGIDFKPFDSLDISDITDAEANTYTLLLTILPPVLVIGVGIVVLVRRKYS